MSAFLELDGLSKRFGATAVLADLDLAVARGTILALLGASGCGKTTLLRLIAGFEAADAGALRLGGVVLADGSTFVPPQHRGIGVVPQDGALFPHLSVGRNIGFGLPRARRAAAVAEMLDLIGLPGHAGRAPHALSGGQQQRVALARALAVRPALLLLDEPFNALDVGLRQELCRDVRRILKAREATAILVTHDRDEAFGLADHVAVMSEGRIVQVGEPREVYRGPATLAAAALTGPVVCLPGRLRDGVVATALGPLAAAGEAGSPEAAVTAMLRPEQIVPAAEGRGTKAVVVAASFLGPLAWVELRLEDAGEASTLKACWPAADAPEAGTRLSVSVAGAARIFPAS